MTVGEVKELPDGELKRLGKALDLPYVLHASAFSPSFGNAILSRYPIVSSTKCKLNGAHSSETRAMLSVDIDISEHPLVPTPMSDANPNDTNTAAAVAGDGWQPFPASPSTKMIQVVMTHLDHRSELARMEQLEELFAHIDKEKPHILMGDFNCLNRSDYTEEVWEKLYQIRKKNSWELPVSDLTESLATKHNYKDTWAMFHPDKVDYLFGTPEKPEEHASRNRHWVNKVHPLATWYLTPLSSFSSLFSCLRFSLSFFFSHSF